MKNIFFILPALVIILLACSSSDNNPVPGVPVNIQLNLNDPQYASLNAINGSVVIGGGVSGIIVYRATQEDYYAFDRTCTYQPEKKCAVNIDASFTTATCPCTDSSMYQLSNQGVAFKGPAKAALKLYQTSVAGNTLFINN